MHKGEEPDQSVQVLHVMPHVRAELQQVLHEVRGHLPGGRADGGTTTPSDAVVRRQLIEPTHAGLECVVEGFFSVLRLCPEPTADTASAEFTCATPAEDPAPSTRSSATNEERVRWCRQVDHSGGAVLCGATGRAADARLSHLL